MLSFYYIGRPNRRPIATAFAAVIVLVLVITTGCDAPSGATTNSPIASSAGLSGKDKVVFDLVRSEEIVLELMARLKPLRVHLENSGRVASSGLFLDTVQYQGLESHPELDNAKIQITNPGVVSVWPVASQPIKVTPAEIWQPLLERYRLDDCRIGALSGKVLDDKHFELEISIESRLRSVDQEDVTDQTESPRPLVGMNSSQTLIWVVGENDAWQIEKWIQKNLNLVSADRPVFSDATTQAIPDEELRSFLTNSIHRTFIQTAIQRGEMELAGGFAKYKQFADWPSAFQFPTASVVDYDSDGLDDLFVSERWGPATMLRNRGDGTFEDATEKCGLVIERFANFATFADFDNDGDPDAFVGGTLDPSSYYENKDGKFIKKQVFNNLKHAISAAAADLNGDGLLDLYVATYDGSEKRMRVDLDDPTFEDRLRRATSYLDRSGPANQVLVNQNGALQVVEIGDTLKQFRNTYQGVWSDFDDDGDPDLYIANDFSPDAFLRNDTPKMSLEPKFTEVTKEVFPDAETGFGMGACWGDYDSDGRMDLYVSNMYSKAGNRIIKQIGDVSPQVSVSARGNFLYHKTDGVFQQVAGKHEGDIHVSKVGWSYGGQFADFNNDSHLDLYVPSGFFTAPSFSETDKDL